MYYKFTRSKGTYQIPVREDFNSDISKYFNGDIIFSEQDEISDGESKYVLNIDDGLLYDSYNVKLRKPNFDKSKVSDVSVVNLTKVGLDVFDKKNGAVIYHASIDEHLMMDLEFTKDKKNNIWVPVSYCSENGWKSGFIIYKNYKNNFANVLIKDFRYTTVLTDGEIDNEKLKELGSKSVEPIMRAFSVKALKSSKSSGSPKKTTTTNNKSKKTGPKKNADLKFTKEEKKAMSIESKIKINHPDIVQNSHNYPKYLKRAKLYENDDGTTHRYTMYEYDYTSIPLNESDLKDIYEAEDRNVRTLNDNFKYNSTYYNRFKKALPDDILTRGFMHIFFSRPDLNLLNSSQTALRSQIEKDAFFKFKWTQKPNLVKQLIKNSGEDNNFMMLLSNKAESFSSIDESIKYADYGRTFQNQSIMLGKGIFDSLVAGTLEIKYTDTRDLDILALHKMWIQYISNVYHGSWDPKTTYIWKKIIDYAVSVEIVVTAEDFETVLYWSKYYGVFPINVPYSALSWDSGNLIIKPDFSITYGYSWREEWNPASLTELNMNCFKNEKVETAKYIPTYNSNYGRSGTTWVGAPFVELIKDPDGKGKNYANAVDYKLRFKPGPIEY